MDPHEDISMQTMQTIFNRSPRGFQFKIISHILRMITGDLKKQPVLMVQPTGSGKSTVPLTVATADGGITIIIENTLSLGTDQAMKVPLIAQSSTLRYIRSYHLDSFKTEKDQQALSSSIISHCSKNNNTSIILFTSPETLLKKIWSEFLQDIHRLNKINLICIDEIHLFVDFGCSFRSSFQQLRSKIFNIFRLNNDECTVPFLLMTATFNVRLHSLLETMIGYKILQQNTFWAPIDSFKKRHIKIDLSYSNQHFNLTKRLLSNYFGANNDDFKCIIITNTAKRAAECQDSLDHWLDVENKISGDTVLVVGNQDPELKFAFTTQFTNTKFSNQDNDDGTTFRPRFLLGTSGCIGAGLDCPDVHLVVRMGLPTSIINFIQEMGRCGRTLPTTNTSESIDQFHIIFTIHDYVYLFERLYIIDNDDNIDTAEKTNVQNNNENVLLSIDEYRKIEIENLNSIASLLFLNYGCWHNYLEISSINPFSNSNAHTYVPCITNCPYCTNTILTICKPINRHAICSFLVAKMFNNPKQYNAIELGDELFKYPGSGISIYGRKTAPQPERKFDCYITIMQLILSGILSMTAEPAVTPKSYCLLSIDTDNAPKYLKDQFWFYIRQF